MFSYLSILRGRDLEYKIWGWEKNPQPTHIYLDLNLRRLSLFPKSIQSPNLLFSSMPIFFPSGLNPAWRRGKVALWKLSLKEEDWPTPQTWKWNCIYTGSFIYSFDQDYCVFPRVGLEGKWLTASIFPWHFHSAVPSNLSSMWPWAYAPYWIQLYAFQLKSFSIPFHSIQMPSSKKSWHKASLKLSPTTPIAVFPRLNQFFNIQLSRTFSKSFHGELLPLWSTHSKRHICHTLLWLSVWICFWPAPSPNCSSEVECTRLAEYLIVWHKMLSWLLNEWRITSVLYCISTLKYSYACI